ncbi:MAG: hypothetical protein OXI33_01995 [Chloroflexota bacterium]|nr:hypothetical protein [Chloroflexota bacterium]
MPLSGDNPFIALDPETGLPKPGQDVKVPETPEEIKRWHAVRRAWAAYNRDGDMTPLREVGILPSEPTVAVQAGETVNESASPEKTARSRGIVELISEAPWREAVTYRKTWPHEYVVIKKDGQQGLLAEVCQRFCAVRVLTAGSFA